jgi:hypothetical protein
MYPVPEIQQLERKAIAFVSRAVSAILIVVKSQGAQMAVIPSNCGSRLTQ